MPPDSRIEFRIGIHVGDIIFDDNDIFGDGVNIAARLEGIAEAGGLCLSDDAYRQVRGKVAANFESMGEPLEGQLAVARVVLNRAASGQYPNSWCAVVKQKAQFSFVRGGRFPRIATGSEAWAKAKAITRIAMENGAESLPLDVLWYHADYVAPKWRKNLSRVDKIGAHIFYRS